MDYTFISATQNPITIFCINIDVGIFNIQDAALASLLIRPAPLLAFQTANFIGTSEEFIKVPRVYIKTLQDRVLLLDKQEAMIKMWPPNKVLSMDNDHSPFFSSPLELYRHLLQIGHLIAKKLYS